LTQTYATPEEGPTAMLLERAIVPDVKEFVEQGAEIYRKA
jgi:hypothetical protein